METQKTQTNHSVSYTMVTITLMTSIPLFLIGCAWLLKHPPFILIGYLLAICMIYLTCLRGFSLGMWVGFTAFLFLISAGTSIHYLSMEKAGERTLAIVVDKQHSGGYQEAETVDCKLVTTDKKPIRYPLTRETGCWGLKIGQQVTILQDPSGWFSPIIANRVKEETTSQLWIASCIGIVLEILIVYSRQKLSRRI